MDKATCKVKVSGLGTIRDCGAPAVERCPRRGYPVCIEHTDNGAKFAEKGTVTDAG